MIIVSFLVSKFCLSRRAAGEVYLQIPGSKVLNRDAHFVEYLSAGRTYVRSIFSPGILRRNNRRRHGSSPAVFARVCCRSTLFRGTFRGSVQRHSHRRYPCALRGKQSQFHSRSGEAGGPNESYGLLAYTLLSAVAGGGSRQALSQADSSLWFCGPGRTRCSGPGKRFSRARIPWAGRVGICKEALHGSFLPAG